MTSAKSPITRSVLDQTTPPDVQRETKSGYVCPFVSAYLCLNVSVLFSVYVSALLQDWQTRSCCDFDGIRTQEIFHSFMALKNWRCFDTFMVLKHWQDFTDLWF